MPNWRSMTALLASIPDLPGARCIGKADLFEATIAEYRAGNRPTPDLTAARTAALRLCTACPALDPCRAWTDRLQPTQRPRGVIAGRVVRANGRVSP